MTAAQAKTSQSPKISNAELRQVVEEGLDILGFDVAFESHGIVVAKVPHHLYRQFDKIETHRLCFDVEVADLDHSLELIAPGSRFLELLCDALASHGSLACAIAVPSSQNPTRESLLESLSNRLGLKNGHIADLRLNLDFDRLVKFSVLATAHLAERRQHIVPVVVDIDKGEFLPALAVADLRLYDVADYKRAMKVSAMSPIAHDDLASLVGPVYEHARQELERDLEAAWKNGTHQAAAELAEIRVFYGRQIAESAYPEVEQRAFEQRKQALRDRLTGRVDFEIAQVLAVYMQNLSVRCVFGLGTKQTEISLPFDQQVGQFTFQFCGACETERTDYYVSVHRGELLCTQHGGQCVECGDGSALEELICEATNHPPEQGNACKLCRKTCCECDSEICHSCRLQSNCCDELICAGCARGCVDPECAQQGLCSAHSSQCVTCDASSCQDHTVPTICCEEVCAGCALECSEDGEVVCAEHARHCLTCEATFCHRGHVDRTCNVCSGLVCSTCDPEICKCAIDEQPVCAEHVMFCKECQAALCATHSDAKCCACGTPTCPDHREQCPYCETTVCGEHILLSTLDDVHACPRCVKYCGTCGKRFREDQLVVAGCCAEPLCPNCVTSCAICGELVCTEAHSIKCQDCEARLCAKTHAGLFCVECKVPRCIDHLQTCDHCNIASCHDHFGISDVGSKLVTYCPNCRVSCHCCRRPMRTDQKVAASCCDQPACPHCVSRCERCSRLVCATHRATGRDGEDVLCDLCFVKCVDCGHAQLVDRTLPCRDCGDPVGECCGPQRCTECCEPVCTTCSKSCEFCDEDGSPQALCRECSAVDNQISVGYLKLCQVVDCGLTFCSQHGGRGRIWQERESTEAWLCEEHSAVDPYDGIRYAVTVMRHCSCCLLFAVHRSRRAEFCISCEGLSRLSRCGPRALGLFNTLVKPQLTLRDRAGRILVSDTGANRKLIAYYIQPLWSNNVRFYFVNRKTRQLWTP